MDGMDGPAVESCTLCDALVDSRSQIVNGDGPEDADVLFVGEAPGANEDAEGVPFVGRSGDVLDDALRDVGLAREDVRITNCVRCRPPENRDPTSEELANCRPYLDREIELVDPEVVVTLGKVPGEHLLERDVAVTTETGDVERVTLGNRERDLLICLHPAATLYDGSQKAAFRETSEGAARMAGAEGRQATLEEFEGGRSPVPSHFFGLKRSRTASTKPFPSCSPGRSRARMREETSSMPSTTMNTMMRPAAVCWNAKRSWLFRIISPRPPAPTTPREMAIRVLISRMYRVHAMNDRDT